MYYDDAKKYRGERKAKAERMASGDPHAKTDSSDWSEAGPLDADVQTGERPVSPRQYKRGGTVSGDFAQMRADRKPRKSGGTANALINRDVKAANEERDGTKHVGGFAAGGNVGDTVPTSRLAFSGGESKLAKAAGLKKGGRTGKDIGGSLSMLSPALMVANAIRKGDKDGANPPVSISGLKSGGKVDASVSGTPIKGGRTPRATGGGAIRVGNPTPNMREPRKSGGRTGKGKMNVNIIIGQPGGAQAPMPAPPMPPPAMAGPVRPPMPAPGPVMPPPGAGAPPPMPMGRKSGGRAYTAGAGGGEGRLEKIEKYGDRA